MPRKATPVKCSESDKETLEKIVRSHSSEQRIVRRAKMILALVEGKRIMDVSEELSESQRTVGKWRDRFNLFGIEGLKDAARSGKPISYGEEFKKMVLCKLQETPPNGLSRWDGEILAQELNTSKDAVWRLLKKEGIQLARQRTWCVSTDPEFTTKAADIIGLYLNPPENAIVLCVDEKPGMQALSRKTGYVVTQNKKTVRAIQSTYRRNGTQNLFAALNVATGQIYAKATKFKKRPDFQNFLDLLLEEYPDEDGREIHIIMDNYCTHKRNEEWLERHPHVHFHFTPTSGSWLNQVEIWFGILTRKVLRGASFDSTAQLVEEIKRFLNAYNETATPFVWRKREVRGSQIKNTISNLCN